MYINCGISIRLKKKHRKDDLSPVFAMSPQYLNIVGNILSKLDITHDANLLMIIR